MKNNTKLSLTILRSIQIIGIVLIALLHLLDSWVLKDRSEVFLLFFLLFLDSIL
jgi:hypothetical protein